MNTQHLLVPFPDDAYAYGTRSDGGTHGLVLTRQHVVELILDLAGYTSDRDLTECKLLEPSCGHGAFLVVAVQRLLDSCTAQNKDPQDLTDAIRAFDIDESHVAYTRTALARVLTAHKVGRKATQTLVTAWVRMGDFLLAPIADKFDYVVGNPPYIRIEQLSPALQVEYRSRYSTIYDRADLYVAFIERGLRLLSTTGILSFICADRWTLNRYGSPLRSLISSGYEVRTYVDLHHASPFETDVIAYPSIFVIAKQKNGRPVRVVTMSSATAEECESVIRRVRGRKARCGDINVAEHKSWFVGSDPWVLGTPQQLGALRELESRLPLLEASGGTAVRIGVATGNDSVYIVPSTVDIESDRLLPLVMRDDIEAGSVRNSHRCVINTYTDGGTIDLEDYPRLSRYFRQHEDHIRRRHVAKKLKKGWFRTIDRVYPSLAVRPKLLIPDIAGSNEVTFEAGHYYPHHNLYFVVSNEWDMEVLGGLLSSRMALFFVWSYAVKMRGGYLRFQAQYLRRIRVPRPEDVPVKLKRQIKSAFKRREFGKLDQLACAAYGIARLPDFDFVDTRK